MARPARGAARLAVRCCPPPLLSSRHLRRISRDLRGHGSARGNQRRRWVEEGIGVPLEPALEPEPCQDRVRVRVRVRVRARIRVRVRVRARVRVGVRVRARATATATVRVIVRVW